MSDQIRNAIARIVNRNQEADNPMEPLYRLCGRRFAGDTEVGRVKTDARLIRNHLKSDARRDDLAPPRRSGR